MQTDQVMGNLTFNTNLLQNKIIAIKKQPVALPSEKSNSSDNQNPLCN